MGQGSRPYGATLYQKVEMFDILGPHSHRAVPIEVKFCTAKRTPVSVGPAKFELNRCNESPLHGEKPDFWTVSKSNTGSLPLRGILPVISVSYLCLKNLSWYRLLIYPCKTINIGIDRRTMHSIH